LIWKFLLILFAVSLLIQYGALTVWVGVLATSLQAVLALVVIAVLCAAGYFLWRHYRKPTPVKPDRITHIQ
jgi:membrane protein implicated in regulation of membrane protease activity